jgi:hypothetical protein
MIKRSARLVCLALLGPIAYKLRDPSMRDIWGMPRPDALLGCEASDPVKSLNVMTGKRDGSCGMGQHVELLVSQC